MIDEQELRAIIRQLQMQIDELRVQVAGIPARVPSSGVQSEVVFGDACDPNVATD